MVAMNRYLRIQVASLGVRTLGAADCRSTYLGHAWKKISLQYHYLRIRIEFRLRTSHPSYLTIPFHPV